MAITRVSIVLVMHDTWAVYGIYVSCFTTWMSRQSALLLVVLTKARPDYLPRQFHRPGS